MPYDQSVRTLMNNAGYDNSKIGYNPDSGYVTYDKVNFMKPQMNVNGTTFTDQNSFDQAHKDYQSAYNPYQGDIFKSAEDSMPYSQRLAYYASNPTAGQSELDRSNKVLGVYNALGDTAKANDATAHIARVQQVLGPQQAPADKQYGDILSAVIQKLTGPQQQYDVYSSPEYQAAKSQSDYGAQQAVRTAQESMGATGFGRSTNLADRAQGIQQDATQRLLTQVVPQLISQHNGEQQQQLGNLIGLLSPLLQQQELTDTRKQNDFNNTRTTQQDHIDLAKWQTDTYGINAQPKSDTGVAFAQTAGLTPISGRNQQLNETQTMANLTGQIPDGKGGYTKTSDQQQRDLDNMWTLADRTGTIPDSLANIYGITPGTSTLAAKAQAASIGNQQAQILMDVWKATNSAPAGLEGYGVKAGTQYSTQSGNSKPLTVKEATDILDNSVFIQPGQTTTDPQTGESTKTGRTIKDKPGLIQAILAMGMPDNQTEAVASAYGITPDELSAAGN